MNEILFSVIQFALSWLMFGDPRHQLEVELVDYAGTPVPFAVLYEADTVSGGGHHGSRSCLVPSSGNAECETYLRQLPTEVAWVAHFKSVDTHPSRSHYPPPTWSSIPPQQLGKDGEDGGLVLTFFPLFSAKNCVTLTLERVRKDYFEDVQVTGVTGSKHDIEDVNKRSKKSHTDPDVTHFDFCFSRKSGRKGKITFQVKPKSCVLQIAIPDKDEYENILKSEEGYTGTLSYRLQRNVEIATEDDESKSPPVQYAEGRQRKPPRRQHSEVGAEETNRAEREGMTEVPRDEWAFDEKSQIIEVPLAVENVDQFSEDYKFEIQFNPGKKYHDIKKDPTIHRVCSGKGIGIDPSGVDRLVDVRFPGVGQHGEPCAPAACIEFTDPDYRLKDSAKDCPGYDNSKGPTRRYLCQIDEISWESTGEIDCPMLENEGSYRIVLFDQAVADEIRRESTCMGKPGDELCEFETPVEIDTLERSVLRVDLPEDLGDRRPMGTFSPGRLVISEHDNPDSAFEFDVPFRNKLGGGRKYDEFRTSFDDLCEDYKNGGEQVISADLSELTQDEIVCSKIREKGPAQCFINYPKSRLAANTEYDVSYYAPYMKNNTVADRALVTRTQTNDAKNFTDPVDLRASRVRKFFFHTEARALLTGPEIGTGVEGTIGGEYILRGVAMAVQAGGGYEQTDSVGFGLLGVRLRFPPIRRRLSLGIEGRWLPSDQALRRFYLGGLGLLRLVTLRNFQVSVALAGGVVPATQVQGRGGLGLMFEFF